MKKQLLKNKTEFEICFWKLMKKICSVFFFSERVLSPVFFRLRICFVLFENHWMSRGHDLKCIFFIWIFHCIIFTLLTWVCEMFVEMTIFFIFFIFRCFPLHHLFRTALHFFVFSHYSFHEGKWSKLKTAASENCELWFFV